jgi:uncharacterized protein with HEPN domain
MLDELKKYLQDVLIAVEHIQIFTATIKTLNDYSSNLMLKKAVERELEIIGEALSNALKMEKSIAISNARKIVNTRNKIIHGYDEVEDAMI